MFRPLSVFLFFLMFSLLPGCNREDLFDVLSTRKIESLYFSSASNDFLTLDVHLVKENSSKYRAVLPKDTDLSGLALSFDISGYAFFVDSVRQESGKTVNDFSSALDYMLYSYDGKKNDYLIHAEESIACFDSFSFSRTYNSGLDSDVSADISGNGVWFYLSHNYSLKGLTPSFEFQKDSVSLEGSEISSGSTPVDFSSPRKFTVVYDTHSMEYQVSAYRLTGLTFRGEDNGFDGDYTAHLDDKSISVEVISSADITSLIPDFSFLGDTILFDGEEIVSGKTALDFSSPVTVEVSTKTGLSCKYTLTVTLAENPYNEPNNPVSPGGNPETDTSPPGEVALTDLKLGPTKISLEWRNPGDGDFDHVEISWGGGNTEKSGTSCDISGLGADTDYTITLKTVDTTGNVSEGVTLALSTLIAGASSRDVYIIDSVEKLAAINPPGGHLGDICVLVCDLDLEGWGSWTPIGDATNTFTGTFYGSAHTVSNMGIISFSGDQGLFGHVTNGEIYDLVLENVVITPVSDTVGALVGINKNGNIRNCSASGSIQGAGNTVGGLIGSNNGGTLTTCYADVDVDSSGNYIGGFVAFNTSSGDINNCYNIGLVNSTSQSAINVGGFVAYNYNSATVSNCYTSCAVSYSSSTFTGRIHDFVGYKFGSSITDCHFNVDSAVFGDPEVVGIDLTDQTKFSNWDFVGDTVGTDDYWSMDPDVNNGWPYLTGMKP